ncbi:aspartate-semialdehyde dehydrogenase [Klebsiella pneumoniae subsp. pneumoniae]|nr:aspartate-semialdehyde dehydrogenase [Klebsiella pneumoniae subsp. pneumoniae]
MSEGWNIAVLGATGAVGEALLETLAERQFPVGEIFALARNDSAGEHLRFGGKSVIVKDAAEFDWTQAQLAFFAAGVEASAAYVEEATNAGCLVIDLSGLFALEPDVPLVVPDVNPFVLGDYRNRNLIAVPNSLTSQLLTALKPLIDQGGLSRISVTNLLSASGQGEKAVDALAGQSAKLLNGIPIDEETISLVASWRSTCCRCCRIVKVACAEERRIVDEARKILQDDGLMISASVVRVAGLLRPCADGELRSDAPAGGGGRRATLLPAARISNFLKRANSRLRLAMPQAMPASPSAACITITVCRSRSSSGR